jgi:hypothetical protein
MSDHHNFGDGEWPFADEVSTGAFATVQVMEGKPVLFVAHDEDDGSWQFLHSENLTDDDADDLRYVCLGCVFERHRNLMKVADMPLGWEASRKDADSPWQLVVSPPLEE